MNRKDIVAGVAYEDSYGHPLIVLSNEDHVAYIDYTPEAGRFPVIRPARPGEKIAVGTKGLFAACRSFRLAGTFTDQAAAEAAARLAPTGSRLDSMATYHGTEWKLWVVEWEPRVIPRRELVCTVAERQRQIAQREERRLQLMAKLQADLQADADAEHAWRSSVADSVAVLQAEGVDCVSNHKAQTLTVTLTAAQAATLARALRDERAWTDLTATA